MSQPNIPFVCFKRKWPLFSFSWAVSVTGVLGDMT